MFSPLPSYTRSPSNQSIESYEFISSDLPGLLSSLKIERMQTSPTAHTTIPITLSYEDVQDNLEPLPSPENMPKIIWPEEAKLYNPTKSSSENLGLPKTVPSKTIIEETPRAIGASSSAITRQFVVPPSINRKTI